MTSHIPRSHSLYIMKKKKRAQPSFNNDKILFKFLIKTGEGQLLRIKVSFEIFFNDISSVDFSQHTST